MSEISLRDYTDSRLAEIEKRIEQRFREQERALKIADTHAKTWRQHANEWRQAMTDREREFLPRTVGAIYAALSIIALIVAVGEKIWR